MSRIHVALMNLAESLSQAEVSTQSLGRIEIAVRDLAQLRAMTVPQAIFDGQLLASAEEVVPLLHDSRYLGIPELAGRWQRIVAVISGWYEATQGEDE